MTATNHGYIIFTLLLSTVHLPLLIKHLALSSASNHFATQAGVLALVALMCYRWPHLSEKGVCSVQKHDFICSQKVFLFPGFSPLIAVLNTRGFLGWGKCLCVMVHSGVMLSLHYCYFKLWRVLGKLTNLILLLTSVSHYRFCETCKAQVYNLFFYFFTLKMLL